MASRPLRLGVLSLGGEIFDWNSPHFSNYGRMIIMPVFKNAPNRKREHLTRLSLVYLLVTRHGGILLSCLPNSLT